MVSNKTMPLFFDDSCVYMKQYNCYNRNSKGYAKKRNVAKIKIKLFLQNP